MAYPKPEQIDGPFFIDEDDGEIWEEDRSEPGSGARHLTDVDAVMILNLLTSAADEQRDETCAAVAAETERSWKAVLALSVEELRVYESAESSANEYSRHLSRHSAFVDAIAAIRNEPDVFQDIDDGHGVARR